MRVQIIESKTGRLVFTHEVVVHSMNHPTNELEYLAQAWRGAVSAGHV